ncbi:MAG: T9SS type A sorting domain-containing protein [Bacteroidota bacterium]
MKHFPSLSLLYPCLICACCLSPVKLLAEPMNEGFTATPADFVNPPSNDDLANAIPVTGVTLQDFVHVVSENDAQNATLEANEEECANQRSWWYVFTPVHSTWYTLNTSSTATDVSIGVYTGTSHPLQPVACFIGINPNDPQGNSVELTAGTTYYIRTATDFGGNEAIDTRISRTPFVWTGAENTRWDDADNWQPRGVPADSARVTIPDAGASPRLRSATVTLLELIVDGGDLGVQPDASITLLAQNQGLEINDDGRLSLEGDLEVFTDVSPAIDIADGRVFVRETGTIITSETVRFTEGTFDLEGFLQTSSSTGNALEIGERESLNIRESGELKITTATALGVLVGPNGNLNVDGQFSVENAGADGVYLSAGVNLSFSSDATASINQASNNLIACENASAGVFNGGNLTLSNPGNFAISGGQLTNAGEGTLIANGVISATLDFEEQTRIEVGASGQCLTFTESVPLAMANLTLDIEGVTACAQYDQIIFAEAADISDATLTLRGSYVPQVGESFTLFNNTHSAPITGTLAGLVEGDTLSFNEAIFKISYVSGDGDDIVLSTVSFDDPPANDDLVNAFELELDVSSSLSATVGLTGATTEPNEVDCNGTVSWWYTFTAPSDGEYSIIAGLQGIARDGSNNDITMGIFTGSNHPLTDIACVDGNQGQESPFEFGLFNFVAGETYAIRVGVQPKSKVDEIGLVVRRLPARWIGTISNNWYEAANWSAGVVPDPTSEVVIEAAPNPAIIPSGEVNVAKLEIDNGGDFTLAEGATLTLAGNQEGLEVTSGQASIDGTLNVTDNEFINVRVNAILRVGATGVMNITERGITVNDSLICAGTITLNGGAQMEVGGSGTIVVEETGSVSINEATSNGLTVFGGNNLIEGTVNITNAGRVGVSLPLGGIVVTETGSLSVSGSDNFGVAFQFNSTAVIENRGTVAFFDNRLGAFNRNGKCHNRNGSIFRVEGLIRSDIEFDTGSRLEPGSSPGCVTFENFTDLGGATVAIEIDGTTACTEYDQLLFDIFLDVGGAALALSGSYIPVVGDTFVIARPVNQESSGGQFVGLPEGATLEYNGALLEITYQAGDGEEIMLTTLQGANRTVWTGAVDSDWYKPGNWNTGAIPTSTQEVLIEAAPNPAILPSGAVEVASLLLLDDGGLTIDEGAALTLTAGTTGLQAQSGTLTINGHLTVAGQPEQGSLLAALVTIGINGKLAYEQVRGEVILRNTLGCQGELLLSGGAGLSMQGPAQLFLTETGICQITDAAGTGLNLNGSRTIIDGEVMIINSGGNGIYVADDAPIIETTGSVVVKDAGGHGIRFINSIDFSIRNAGILSISGSALNAVERGNISNFIGSTFRGDGNVNTNFSHSRDATVEVGDAVGCLTFENRANLEDGIIAFSINGTIACSEYDQITFNATADISDAQLVLTGDYTPALGASFTLLNNNIDNAIRGTFAGLAEGDTLIQNGTAWQISYAGGDGNDVVITALSEDAPPSNDDLVNAISIDGLRAAASNPTNGLTRATVEPGEIDCGGTVSWWYSFTPPVSGPYEFSAGASTIFIRDNSDNDITLGLYTGNSHPLNPVACFTENQSPLSGGEVGGAFLQAGVTYSIRIGVKPNVQVDEITLFVLRESVRWVGTVSSNWYEGSNWSTGVVPDSGSVISIRPAPNPAILPSGTVDLTRLRVRSEGSFTLAEGATMRISGTTSTPFISGLSGMQINSEQATINGTLLISDVDDIGLDTDGGVLTVGATGSVEISGAEEGIATGNFTNHGRIFITGTSENAITTATDCANYGSITLLDGQAAAIDLTGTFLNEGSLTIQNFADDGVETFTGGTLQVGAAASVTIDHVRRGLNGLILLNDGAIDITTTSNDAINTGGNGSNNGSIVLSGIGSDGIDIEEGFNFTNTGTIRILDVAAQALDDGTFEQTANGELFIAGEITSVIQLAAGSALHPGSSPGCVESTSLSNLAGVELYVELEGTTACAEYDQLFLGDQAVDLTDAVLILSGDYIPAAGDEFVIMKRLSTTNITGTFAGLPEGATTELNGALLQISYLGGTGNDIVLTATGALPLDLLSFTGEAINQANRLNWTTTNEEDFSHFEVEFSTTGTDWQRVGTVMGNQGGAYQFVHDALTGYYRLTMIDLDGSFTYSKVVYLENFSGANAGEMLVYPNPGTGRFTVDLTKVDFSAVRGGELRLLDVQGRMVWTGAVADGQVRITVSLPEFPAGTYLLTLAGGSSIVKRLVQIR